MISLVKYDHYNEILKEVFMPALQSLFGKVTLTAQGVEQLHTMDVKVKGRERQFLLLLWRDDNVSRQICAAMLPKVDLSSLLTLGLIDIEDKDNFYCQLSMVMPLSAQVSMNPNTNRNEDNLDTLKDKQVVTIEDEFIEVDPMLQLAAGVF